MYNEEATNKCEGLKTEDQDVTQFRAKTGLHVTGTTSAYAHVFLHHTA